MLILNIILHTLFDSIGWLVILKYDVSAYKFNCYICLYTFFEMYTTILHAAVANDIETSKTICITTVMGLAYHFLITIYKN